MKQRAPALPNSPTFQQLWDTLGSKLIETVQEHLFYTQGVRGSSPLPPILGDLNYQTCMWSAKVGQFKPLS